MKIGKSLIKKVALALAGVAAITGVGFGVKAIVDYTKNDLKEISPSFEVGNLGADGKFVDDKSTLYTKDAFGCYGLQVKPDFDSAVNYKIYYYDILDNYISSTEMLSDGYSAEAPLNGAYARMVIEPREDEDGKISLTERISYPKDLTVKVKKEQDINERFTSYKGKLLQVVDNIADSVFIPGFKLTDDTFDWTESQYTAVTSTTVLKIDGGSNIVADFSSLASDFSDSYAHVYEFKDLPDKSSVFSYFSLSNDNEFKCAFNKQTKYVLIWVDANKAVEWSQSVLDKIPACFTITK